jgi:hypothetical protein
MSVSRRRADGKDVAAEHRSRRTRTRYGPGVSIPTTDRAEIEALAGSSPNFAAWEQNEPYTIALLIKVVLVAHRPSTCTGRALRAPAITFYGSRPAPRRTCITRVVAALSRSRRPIVNDTTWSTIVGTWRPGRLELYVDGWSRASSTAAATTPAPCSASTAGAGASRPRRTSTATLRSSRASPRPGPAMVRRWHADPFGFLRPWGELPALMGSAPPATPLDRHRRGHVPDGVACRNPRAPAMFREKWLSMSKSRHEPGSGAARAGASRCKRAARREAGAVPGIRRTVSPYAARGGSIRRALGARDQVRRLPYAGAAARRTACHTHGGATTGHCASSRSSMRSWPSRRRT